MLQAKHTIGESHSQLEETTSPDRLVLAGNTTLPDFEVEHTLRSPCRFCEEAEWVVLAPLLSVIRQSVSGSDTQGNACACIGLLPLLLEAVLAQRHCGRMRGFTRRSETVSPAL
jgi:hypothetical protein